MAGAEDRRLQVHKQLHQPDRGGYGGSETVKARGVHRRGEGKKGNRREDRSGDRG